MVHYGKKIDTLTSDEKKLIVIDTLMTKVMEDMMKENGIDMFKLMTCQQLGEERTKLVSKILGLDVENSEENFDYIEETNYSYQGFLKDKRKNQSQMSETLHQSMWN